MAAVIVLHKFRECMMKAGKRDSPSDGRSCPEHVLSGHDHFAFASLLACCGEMWDNLILMKCRFAEDKYRSYSGGAAAYMPQASKRRDIGLEWQHWHKISKLRTQH